MPWVMGIGWRGDWARLGGLHGEGGGDDGSVAVQFGFDRVGYFEEGRTVEIGIGCLEAHGQESEQAVGGVGVR